LAARILAFLAVTLPKWLVVRFPKFTWFSPRQGHFRQARKSLKIAQIPGKKGSLKGAFSLPF